MSESLSSPTGFDRMALIGRKRALVFPLYGTGVQFGEMRPDQRRPWVGPGRAESCNGDCVPSGGRGTQCWSHCRRQSSAFSWQRASHSIGLPRAPHNVTHCSLASRQAAAQASSSSSCAHAMRPAMTSRQAVTRVTIKPDLRTVLLLFAVVWFLISQVSVSAARARRAAIADFGAIRSAGCQRGTQSIHGRRSCSASTSECPESQLGRSPARADHVIGPRPRGRSRRGSRCACRRSPRPACPSPGLRSRPACPPS